MADDSRTSGEILPFGIYVSQTIGIDPYSETGLLVQEIAVQYSIDQNNSEEHSYLPDPSPSSDARKNGNSSHVTSLCEGKL